MERRLLCSARPAASARAATSPDRAASKRRLRHASSPGTAMSPNPAPLPSLLSGRLSLLIRRSEVILEKCPHAFPHLHGGNGCTERPKNCA